MLKHFFRGGPSVAICRLIFLSFVAVLPFLGGCGETDNPIVDDDDHEEPFHADVDGFVLEVDGAEAYRQFQGTATGKLTVSVGEEIEVHVTFLGPDGAETTVSEEEDDDHDHDHDHEGDEVEMFMLRLTDYDPAIIDIHLPEGEDDHEGDDHDHEGDDHDHEEDDHADEERWRFEVVGRKAGETQITFQLMHGDHPDFTAASAIPVTVQ